MKIHLFIRDTGMKTDMKIFFLINVFTAISYGLPTLLYTKIAYERGYSESFVGFVFAIYSITNILILPFTNVFIKKVGRFHLLIISNLMKVRKLLI